MENKEIVYKHMNFGELSKQELDLHMSFLAKVLNKFSSFDVWEAENIHSQEDYPQWLEEVIRIFTEINNDKWDLENDIYIIK